MLLMAVKRAVAERYMNACSWNLEQQLQYNHVEACSKAALRNIHLAQWVMQLYNSRRLLQAGLHFVFNAAVILLLNCVLRNNMEASDEVAFAIDVFARQSRTGTNYERDCLQVLKDLKILIDRFLAILVPPPHTFSNGLSNVSPNISPNFFTTTIDAQIDTRQGRQGLPNDGGNVYQELMTWIQDDNSRMYSSFRI